jgi:hypothetical protein
MHIVYSAFILAATMASAMGAATHTGMGTAYSGPRDMDATGQNMCEFNPSRLSMKWQVFYGAMNQRDWEAIGGKDSICGRCIKVRGVRGHTTPGHEIKDIYVKIVDQCPDWACDPGNVDFSTVALKFITGYSWDKKKIEWEYADCPDEVDTAEEAADELTQQAEAAEAAAKKAAAAEKTALAAAEEAEAAATAAFDDAETAAAIQAAQKAAAAAAAEARAATSLAARLEKAAEAAKKRAAAALQRAKGRKMLR